MDSFNIDRFGETTTSDVDDKISSLKREFVDVSKQMFNHVEENLKTHLKKTDALVDSISVTKNYIGVGGRRIVSAAKSINRNDVVIRDELHDVKKVTKYIVPKTSAVSNANDELEIQDFRRLTKVGKGVLPTDVVTVSQLNEVTKNVDNLKSLFEQFKANTEVSKNELIHKPPLVENRYST